MNKKSLPRENKKSCFILGIQLLSVIALSHGHMSPNKSTCSHVIFAKLVCNMHNCI